MRIVAKLSFMIILIMVKRTESKSACLSIYGSGCATIYGYPTLKDLNLVIEIFHKIIFLHN